METNKIETFDVIKDRSDYLEILAQKAKHLTHYPYLTDVSNDTKEEVVEAKEPKKGTNLFNKYPQAYLNIKKEETKEEFNEEVRAIVIDEKERQTVDNIFNVQPDSNVAQEKKILLRSNVNSETNVNFDFKLKKLPSKHPEYSIETKYKYKEKTFPRRLSLYEKNIMDLFGYGELIKMDKSLIIEKVEEEKSKTLKKGEEIVIVVTELAYFLAEEECKKAIKNFDKTTNSKEYNEIYKKYIKTILKFKING